MLNWGSRVITILGFKEPLHPSEPSFPHFGNNSGSLYLALSTEFIWWLHGTSKKHWFVLGLITVTGCSRNRPCLYLVWYVFDGSSLILIELLCGCHVLYAGNAPYSQLLFLEFSLITLKHIPGNSFKLALFREH
ncbi:hypothetical protein M0813_23760 [Anaeramoeba flamelloides]|uniref:Uncharacterized protein n=1 Tax=Anaeramoeba flamelloides TaxID=1746091 RepID=A0ABQ8Y8H7_9EUKA|nr:hypothetical protein M0813_23760 [Anaeramoeba flamelloides]